MGETEHPVLYYQRIKRKWQLETDSNPNGDALHTIMFRKVLMEGLPEKIQDRLDNVLGLNYKPEGMLLMGYRK